MKQVLIIFSFAFASVLHVLAINVGDVVTNADGSRGVVFLVRPDGSGTMLAMDDYADSVIWGPGVDIAALPNLVSNIYSLVDTVGYTNTAAFQAVYPPPNLYAGSVVDFENGWVLPSVIEFEMALHSLPIILPVLLANGGTDLSLEYYWTSSEYNSLYAFSYDPTTSYAMTEHKSFKNQVRPIRNFKANEIFYDPTLNYLWNTGETTPQIKVKPTLSSTYSVTASSQDACAQSAEVILFVADNQTEIIEDTICAGEIYNANGFTESATGVYTQIRFADGGCQLTVELHLTVNQPSDTTFNASVSVYESYAGHGFYIPGQPVPGLISDSTRFVSVNGCDSTVYLNLTINPIYETLLQDSVCENYSYSENGFLLPVQTTLGTSIHELNLTTQSGCCDSIVTLHLYVISTTTSLNLDTICEGDTYLFNGNSYTADGLYEVKLINIQGCDSLARLQLKVNKPSTSITHDTICDGDSYLFNGTTYTTQGSYDAHLLNAVGCDSTATLQLKLKQKTASTSVVYVCKDSSYHFNGLEFNTEGLHPVLLLNAEGCDSTATLDLRFNPPTQATIYHTICIGKSYPFDGQDLYAAGTYSRHLSNQKGCDSTITLVLSVSEIDTTYIDATITEGEIYVFNNQVLTQEGVYRDTLQSFYNCDSVLVLNLYVNQLIDKVIIPKGFSPNNDGVNDVFVIENLEQYPLNSILIFNRWGNKLYEGKPYMNDWDGRSYHGINAGEGELPNGTYFYILDLGIGEPVIKGWLWLGR